MSVWHKKNAFVTKMTTKHVLLKATLLAQLTVVLAWESTEMRMETPSKAFGEGVLTVTVSPVGERYSSEIIRRDVLPGSSNGVHFRSSELRIGMRKMIEIGY